MSCLKKQNFPAARVEQWIRNIEASSLATDPDYTIRRSATALEIDYKGRECACLRVVNKGVDGPAFGNFIGHSECFRQGEVWTHPGGWFAIKPSRPPVAGKEQ